MPAILPKPCRAFGCPNTTTGSYCLQHAHMKRDVRRRRQSDAKRPNAHQRGYNRHWSKARRLYLMDNPLCVRCAERGLIVEARVVDHIEPHRGDRLKFWNRDNWQSLCKRCHDKKTVSEDKCEAWY